MGEDTRAADARGGGENGFRARGYPEGPVARSEDAPGHQGDLGPFLLNESALRTWGETIGAHAALPLFIALRGPLGAGKSALARAIARGAGVNAPMPSPTFNLLYRYEAGRDGAEVYHLDLYRLEDPDEVWELGWRELGDGQQIVLVEWPERAEALLPTPRWEITLAQDEDPLLRRVECKAIGPAAPLPKPPIPHE